MEEKFNRLIFVPIAAVLFLMIGYQYVCPAGSNTCYFTSDEKGLFQRYSSGFELVYTEADEDLPSKITSRFNFTERDLDRHAEFNIRGDDVMVFLHIQKTGGTTFGRHLVKNIQLEQPCDCMPGQRKCTCHRPGRAESWLFSRFSTGWSCGLHADWTELTSCVPGVMNKRDKKSAQQNKRALAVCAVITGFFGGVLTLIGMKCTKIGGSEIANARVTFAGGITYMVSGFCGMITFTWWANRVITEFLDPHFRAQKFELGAALFIGWGGSLLLLSGASVLSYFSGKEGLPSSSSQRPRRPATYATARTRRTYMLPASSSRVTLGPPLFYEGRKSRTPRAPTKTTLTFSRDDFV